MSQSNTEFRLVHNTYFLLLIQGSASAQTFLSVRACLELLKQPLNNLLVNPLNLSSH